LLVYKGKTGSGHSRLVLIFGCGLIGNAIVHRLEWSNHARLSHFDLSWTDAQLRQAQCSQIANYITSVSAASPCEFQFVWSAGKGGFASSELDLENESDSFKSILNLFAGLQPGQPSVFHFISSAGGLFEGQTLVNDGSMPMPRRPYGEMKLKQEELVRQIQVFPDRLVKIYRPSTVYGAHEFSYRSGLISHLVWNLLRNHPTTLESNLHALRDYVFVNDVGRYIVKQIQRGSQDRNGLYYLVSAKPSSIFEVKQKLQRLVGKSLLYQFSNVAKNDADITFCREVLPCDWRPCDLNYGLSAVLRKTRNAFLHGSVA